MMEHKNDNDFENNFFFDEDVLSEQPSKIPEDVLEDDDLKKDFSVKPLKKYIPLAFEWLDVIVASLIAVVIIFTFFFRIVAIDGNSMNDTLIHGERVIITDLFYEPKRGDIVVISRNTDNSSDAATYESPIIKRVIATEGELVDIDFEKGIVYVDGVALEENYTKELTHKSFDIQFPVRVKENCVFVLGDNRNDSLDSRSSLIGEKGMVNEKYILGHAVLRVFPLNKIGGLD